MNKIKKLLKKVRLKLNKIGSKKRSKKLISNDFSIISNNCYAGIIYQFLGLKYNTPTIGMYFYPKEYLKFIGNFDYYINQELKIISSDNSKYKDELKKDGNYGSLIGLLDDVEIVLLHFKTPEEAIDKWNRRIARLSKNLIFKFNDQNYCNEEELIAFENLDLKNKICFTSKNYTNLKSNVWVKKYKNRDCIKEDYYSGHRYFDIISYINNLFK